MANGNFPHPLPAPVAWRKVDEERLKEIEDERTGLTNRRRAAEQNVAQVLRAAGVEGFDINDIIASADAIRDALAPFDSGYRDGNA